MQLERVLLLYPVLTVALLLVIISRKGFSAVTAALTLATALISILLYKKIRGKQPQL